jgi:hypothetical protein
MEELGRQLRLSEQQMTMSSIISTFSLYLFLPLFSLKEEKTDRTLHCSRMVAAFPLYSCSFSVMFEQRTMSRRIFEVPPLTMTSLSSRPYGYEMNSMQTLYEPIESNCNFNSLLSLPKQDNPNENTFD